jgi:uncharacterized protein (TIRG00374 family)
MKKWKFAAGAAFSALFLYVALRAAGPDDVVEAFGHAEYLRAVPAALLILASLWLRAYRWQSILLPVKRIPMELLFRATCVGTMANAVFPGRLGELVRAHMVGKRERMPRGMSFATVVGERVLDGLALMLFLAISLSFGSAYTPGWLRETALFAFLGYTLCVLFLLFLKGRRDAAVKSLRVCLAFVPERVRTRLIVGLRSFVDGLGSFRGSKSLYASMLLSPVVWLPNVAAIHLLLEATGIHLPVQVSLILLVALCIVVIVPSAPGYIGTTQFACVAVLRHCGVPPGQALTFSIIYAAIVFVPILLAGLACLIAGHLSFREMRSIIPGEN